jgi:hypothetical protein
MRRKWYNKEKDEYYYETVEHDSMDDYFDWLDSNGHLKEISSGNTYNWSGRISNDIYYHIYKDELQDRYLVNLLYTDTEM